MPLVGQLDKISIQRRGPLPWAVALGLFAASLGVRILFAPALEGSAFVTFYPAIVASTLICGWQALSS